MDLTEGSETSPNINQTPGNHPKVDILNTEHSESLKSRKIVFLCNKNQWDALSSFNLFRYLTSSYCLSSAGTLLCIQQLLYVMLVNPLGSYCMDISRCTVRKTLKSSVIFWSCLCTVTKMYVEYTCKQDSSAWHSIPTVVTVLYFLTFTLETFLIICKILLSDELFSDQMCAACLILHHTYAAYHFLANRFRMCLCYDWCLICEVQGLISCFASCWWHNIHFSNIILIDFTNHGKEKEHQKDGLITLKWFWR
jgi:hypothetical protein